MPPRRLSTISSTTGQDDADKASSSSSVDGNQPQERSTPAIRKGIHVLSRGHRACNVCRRQKMRCEGPVNGPCNRCRNTQQECIFELPPAKPTSSTASTNKTTIAIQTSPPANNTEMASATTTSDDRVERLETQLADLHSMMKEFMASRMTTGTSIPHQATELAGDVEKERDSAISVEGFDPSVHIRPTVRSLSRSTVNSRKSKRHREDTGDLPEEGLEAPLKTLRGLAEAALRRPRVDVLQNQDMSNDAMISNSNLIEMQSRPQTTPFRAPFLVRSNSTSRAASPNNFENRHHAKVHLNDIITKGVLNEPEARRLWAVFSQGCPRFIAACFVQEDPRLNVYEDLDGIVDTFTLTRKTSSFLFVTILAIGAQIDSIENGKHAAYGECCQAAQMYAQRTLLQHAPQLRVEDVMALNLMASYSDYGWLLSGHAVRIAQELSLDTYFSQLMKKTREDQISFDYGSRNGARASSHVSTNISPSSISSIESPDRNVQRSAHKGSDEESEDEQEQIRRLVRGSRIWFFSFLLEHQISYGAGRSAILQHHTVDGCRDFLRVRSPLVTSIDARFVATLELMVLRERHINCLAPFDLPINDVMLGNVHSLNEDLRSWLDYWTSDLRRRGYDEQSFWMASLRIQYATAKLYLSSTSLRRAGTSPDVTSNVRWSSISAGRRDLVIQSVKAAFDALTIAVQNKEYFDLLKWAPHYTIVTVTFSAVFLLKAIRIFPAQYLLPASGLREIFHLGEKLVSRFKEIPSASKFGAVVLHMLRQCSAMSLSPINADNDTDSNQRFNEDRFTNMSRSQTGPRPHRQTQDFSMSTSSTTQNERRNSLWPTGGNPMYVSQAEEISGRPGLMSWMDNAAIWNGFAPLPQDPYRPAYGSHENSIPPQNTHPYPPSFVNPVPQSFPPNSIPQYNQNHLPSTPLPMDPRIGALPPLGRNFESFDQVLRELGLDDNLVNVFDDGGQNGGGVSSTFDTSLIPGEMNSV